MLEGEVEVYEVLVDFINELYEEIVKEKVWLLSGDYYIKYMYFNVFVCENVVFMIVVMVFCLYVYVVIGKCVMEDFKLNKELVIFKWF